MRASGTTLTVGELREVLEGLDDAAHVTGDSVAVLEAVAAGGALELRLDYPTGGCECLW